MATLCPTTFSRRAFVLAALTGSAIADPALARQSPLLTVVAPNGSRRIYDDAALERFRWYDVVTHTLWTEGLQHFRGPLLRDLLLDSGEAAFDLAGRTLTLSALNDFVLDIPASDAFAHDPVVARTANGARMQVRDKGPLWLVYPRDTQPDLQRPEIDERWVWQLTRIEIR